MVPGKLFFGVFGTTLATRNSCLPFFARSPNANTCDSLPSNEAAAKTAGEALGLPKSEVHAEVFEDRVTGVKGDQRCYGLLAGVKLSEESSETYGWLQDRLRQLQTGIVEKFLDITRVALLVKERRGGGSLSILVRAFSTRALMTAAVSPLPYIIT